jgi:uncharacterized caspase-like protein
MPTTLNSTEGEPVPSTTRGTMTAPSPTPRAPSSSTRKKLNVVMLDACRNNPFGGRGHRACRPRKARSFPMPPSSYATQPGSVAQDGTDANSPYSRALAETIRTPGLDIFQSFNQVGLVVKEAIGGSQQPWVSISPIEGEFFFAGR